MYADGKSTRHIAAVFGVSQPTAHRWVRDVERRAASTEFSVRQAAVASGIPKDTILNAAIDGRLPPGLDTALFATEGQARPSRGSSIRPTSRHGSPTRTAAGSLDARSRV
jgi:hypothetical protein